MLETEETRSGQYADVLMAVADGLKATNIIETGLGAMWSGLAFVESLAKRAPGSLTTVEIDKTQAIPADVLAHAAARKVAWRVIHGSAYAIPLAGQYDLLYIDGGADGQEIDAMVRNLKHLSKNLLVNGGWHADIQKALDRFGPNKRLPYRKDRYLCQFAF